MYAIFLAQGKQFRAEPESMLRVPTLRAEPGERVTFDEVLLAERDGEFQVGTPSVPGASVAAEVIRHGKGDKIVVYKMKRRKGYRRKQGHRQGFTEIRILEIDVSGAKSKAKPAPKPKETADTEPAPKEAAAEIDITDAARALAEEHGIDLSTLEGSGKDGRILKGDVDKAIKARED